MLIEVALLKVERASTLVSFSGTKFSNVSTYYCEREPGIMTEGFILEAEPQYELRGRKVDSLVLHPSLLQAFFSLKDN